MCLQRVVELAARSGRPESMFYLGVLLHREGRARPADNWWDWTEQNDDMPGLKDLAELYERYGNPARARDTNPAGGHVSDHACRRRDCRKDRVGLASCTQNYNRGTVAEAWWHSVNEE